MKLRGEKMNRMWDEVILPIIEFNNSKKFVEIGSDTGINTNNILKYCVENNGHLISIDPKPNFDVNKLKQKYGEFFEFYQELSLDRLPVLKDYDSILIDGDHNWYTVFNELKIIESNFNQKNFPLIILHDVAWPYARRDLYYNPDTIPKEYLNAYSKLGMHPDEEILLDEGGLNTRYFNAVKENTPKNGVLTAVEDFIDSTSLDLDFHILPIFNGLGIIHTKNEELFLKIENTILNRNVLKLTEEYYIKSTISKDDKINEYINAYKRCRDESSSKNERIDALVKEKKVLVDESSSKSERIDALVKEKKVLVDESSNKDNCIDDLTNKFEVQKKLVGELNVVIEDNKKQYESLSNTNKELNNQLDAHKEKLLSKDNELKNLQNEISSLSEHNESLMDKNDMQSIKISELENKCKKFNDRNNTLTNTMNNQLDEIVELKSNQNTLNEIIKLLERQINENNEIEMKKYNMLYDKYQNVLNNKYNLEQENLYLVNSNTDLKSKLDELFNSKSWKFTSIFRRLKLIFNK